MDNSQLLLANHAGHTFRIDPRARYSADHLWARRVDDLAIVGVSDYIRAHVAEGLLVEARAVGAVLRRGDEIAQWDAIKTVLSLASPIAGTIIELNPALLQRPGLACADPYEQGWIARMKPSNWDMDAAQLWDAAEYLERVCKNREQTQ